MIQTFQKQKEFLIPEVCASVVGVINSEKKISSLEIADVCGKSHKNVMRDIREMEFAWSKINGLKFELISYKDSRGREKPCYMLNKTESLYIITKYNNEARAKLVMRWHELEVKERMNLVAMSSRLNEMLEEQQPMVVFAEAVQKEPEEMSMDHVAKVLCNLGIATGEIRLRDALVNDRLLCRKEGYRYHPYQKDVERGFFTVRETRDRRGHYSLQTFVTQKGLLRIIKRYYKPMRMPEVKAVQLTFELTND